MSFEEHFNRILRLVSRTGDRLVVFDRQFPEDSFSVMPLSQYEELSAPQPEETQVLPADIALTEEELADKMNSEISNWKNEDEAYYLEEEFKPRNPWKIPEKVKAKAQEDKK